MIIIVELPHVELSFVLMLNTPMLNCKTHLYHSHSSLDTFFTMKVTGLNYFELQFLASINF